MALAAAGGMELFFDVYGTVTMRPISNPATQPVVASFVEGPTCTMSKVSRSLDETAEFNGVICIGNGTGGPPVQAAVWDTNPSSDTWIGGAWGQVPFIFETATFPAPGQSQTDAQLQAQTAAVAKFQQVCKGFDTPSFDCTPNPAIQEGDVIQLTRVRAGLNNTYAIAKITIPLDVGSTMSVTCRPQIQGT